MFREAAFAVALAVALAPSTARAQACCAAPSVTTPARLGWGEAWGAGAQTRVRGVFGAFAADGTYAGTEHGDVETAQDLFVAARIHERAQLALVLPFVQTRRTLPGASAWGGGLGDARASAVVELTRAGERRRVPGLALLAALTVPTGRAPDQAQGALAEDATGTGAYEGALGLELEQRFERVFARLAVSLAQRLARSVAGVREAFSPEAAAVASGGIVLERDIGLGGFVSARRAGAARDAATRAELPGSALALVTVGVASAFPLVDGWRALAAASLDCPIRGLGRNEAVGAGLAVSVLRVWP